MKPTKKAKADAIARSIAIVSNHFKADAMTVGTARDSKCAKVKLARELLWHHLHACGMSWRAIGKHWNRSVHAMTQGARMAVLSLNDADRAMMARLPQIPTTLEIEHAKSYQTEKLPRAMGIPEKSIV